MTILGEYHNYVNRLQCKEVDRTLHNTDVMCNTV